MFNIFKRQKPICANCKHYMPFDGRERYPGELAQCALTETRTVFKTKLSPVTGEKTEEREVYPFCEFKNDNYKCKDYEAKE